MMGNEDLLKQSLLRESFKDDIINSPISKHTQLRYSNQKQTYLQKNYPAKYINHHQNKNQQLTDWHSNSLKQLKDTKKNNSPFILPQVNKPNRKSKNFQDLSRQLLKYEQFNNSDDNNQTHFRLTILRQMTKINFIKEKQQKNKSKSKSKQKNIQLPKKIQLKLEFPERYKRFQLLQNQEKQCYSLRKNQIDKQEDPSIMSGSFYVRKSSYRGLIPSIKKLSSFPAKSMFRSQSQRDPYQNKKLMINRFNQSLMATNRKVTQQLLKKNMQQELKNTQAENNNDNKLKGRLYQKRLPLNLLSYSYRKQDIERQIEKSEVRKLRNSPYLVSMSANFHKYNKHNKQHQLMNQNSSSLQKLNDSMFLSISKKKYAQK